MAAIHEPDSKFDFSHITVNSPVSAPGGAHISKIFYKKSPLYIQAPQSKTKQGIVKSGKKYSTDLIFSNDHEEFIIWIETLETTIKTLLYAHREKWFDNNLEEDDIDTYFLPCLKFIKAGRSYSLRAFMQPEIKAYDDSQQIVDLTSINDATQIITILEFQGIKCSAKSFHLDIEIKQVMVLKPVELFNQCIINTFKSAKVDNPVEVKQHLEPLPYTRQTVSDVLEPLQEPFTNTLSEPLPDTRQAVSDVLEPSQEPLQEPLLEPLTESVSESVSEPMLEEIPEDVCEINLDDMDLDNADTINIKEKTEVYYNMYREARRKAKLAKSLALSSFLEAKRIKNLYMLDDIDDSDSDLDDLEESLVDMENNNNDGDELFVENM